MISDESALVALHLSEIPSAILTRQLILADAVLSIPKAPHPFSVPIKRFVVVPASFVSRAPSRYGLGIRGNACQLCALERH